MFHYHLFSGGTTYVKVRSVVGIIAIFTIGSVLITLLLNPNLLSPTNSYSGSANKLAKTTDFANPIVRENAQLGTSAWQIPFGRAATTQIQAYANTTSILPGGTIVFYVSVQMEGSPYSIDIFRLGWYGGFGGRLMTSIAGQIGHAQGFYDFLHHRLISCYKCRISPTLGLVEANWSASYNLAVPLSWTTGIYLAKFTNVDGLQTYVPFDVQGNNNSTYVVVTPDTTYAAYNAWGGYSLEKTEGDGALPDQTGTPLQAAKVSFDRPYTQDDGSAQVLTFEANAIHWLERQGYDLSYISNVDLHVNANLLIYHRVYLSIGHDEYWTREMRDNVLFARDNKDIALAFLGANAMYWQMRFEKDSQGYPNRTIVCYKVGTAQNDLSRDPSFGKDNSLLTTLWRDPALALPENGVVGIMFDNMTSKVRGFPWQLDAGVKSPLITGTGLQLGQQYGCGLIGYAWDRVFANGVTPANLVVLSTTPTITDNNTASTSNTTYYITPSGAMVFATGSLYWTSALDSYRFQSDGTCLSQSLIVPGIQNLMAHIMADLAIRHSTGQLIS